MRVLLLGGGGLLGSDLQATAPGDTVVQAPRSREVDITDADAVRRAIDAAKPDVVINAAAYTQVDLAESEAELAERVNAHGPRALGEACAARGVRVVHYSTDYVFAGSARAPYREDDPVGPLNAYGRTKLAGERALLESGADALVVRTSWLYGMHGRSFPRTMLERAERGEATRVVDDQHGRPTWAADLAAVTWALARSDARGVVHASSSGEPTTWFGIAARIFERAGRRELLQPCRTSDFASSATRPTYSVLDTSRLEQLTGAALPEWSSALERFMDQIGRAR